MAGLRVTDATFDAEILKGGKPALVDLWAPWCGPCRAMAPLIEELAAEFEGRATVAKLDTDQNISVAARFRVAAIPTLLFFSRGKLVERLVGLHSKAAVRERLLALLAPPPAGAAPQGGTA